MEITGKVHLLFEQSGTFKREFAQLGYKAVDYDIANDYGATDWRGDIMRQISAAAQGYKSIIDNFAPNDLVMAFFPCTYFSSNNWMFFQGTNAKWQGLTRVEVLRRIMKRAEGRQRYYLVLLRLIMLAEQRKFRLIVENPYKDNYLVKNLPYKPFIDLNRMCRGDYYVKPTMYYFINCKPTKLRSYQYDKVQRYVQQTNGDTLERSLISSDYARNFICDNIIGRVQRYTENTLFNDPEMW